MYLLIIILRQAQDEINELKCELSMRHSEIAVLEERCPSFLAHTTLHVPGHSLTYPATHSLIHPTTHPLTHSLTPLTPLTHSLTHPTTHSLIHSLSSHSHHSLTDSSTLFLSRLATTIAAKEMTHPDQGLTTAHSLTPLTH